MTNETWQKIFNGIRPDDLESVIVSLVSGMDIAVQVIARVEDELVVLRGRVGGEAEGGRIFLVPYDRITNVYVNRNVPMLEADLYSPSVPAERKEEIARQVVALREKAKAEAKNAEKQCQDQKTVPVDLKQQLEALRQQAFGNQDLDAPAPAAAPAAPATSTPPTPVNPPTPTTGPASGLPPRFSIPKAPRPRQ